MWKVEFNNKQGGNGTHERNLAEKFLERKAFILIYDGIMKSIQAVTRKASASTLYIWLVYVAPPSLTPIVLPPLFTFLRQ